jgi:hypothetical protein
MSPQSKRRDFIKLAVLYPLAVRDVAAALTSGEPPRPSIGKTHRMSILEIFGIP